MKTVAALFISIILAFTANAQTIKQDSKGNFVQVSKSTTQAALSGKTFTTSKGEVFQVYKSAKGKFFVLRTSKKTNKQYKQYLSI